ncbi:histidinol-phosphate transaminase [Paenibacillus sp. J2TS4]|uniref:histidinol-phosphate transaminase n=1 Tax=Paenibacillus sp. J2TS4 TaxID=2807194 RepID=UPI001B1A120B|nr:histidinol-phosphate transaminase [Paenibacillus sp. J2TS4]GIP36155.1 histidinol-phosphate aminotransferase [Paenibacillus sp. J2TS4]
MSLSKKPLVRKELKQLKPYSPGKPAWEVQAELGLEQVIKLASNENPLGPSPKAVKAIMQQVNELHRYPDSGSLKLKQIIADHYRVRESQVMIGNGADELITLLSEAYLEKTDEVIVPFPSFTEYAFGGMLMGAKIIEAPLDSSFNYDLKQLLSVVTDRTKIVYLCSPHNPTGTYVSRTFINELIQELPDHTILVLDGAYSHYANADDYTNGVEWVQQEKPVVVLQTFSKVYGLAGMRVGFALAAERIIAAMHQVKEPFNVNALAQTAAAAAISDEEHIRRTLAVNEEGRRLLYSAFEARGIHYTPSMSNFILVELGDEAEAVYKLLLEEGVIVRFGGTWGLNGHLRVTIGTEQENLIFIHALDKVRSRL